MLVAQMEESTGRSFTEKESAFRRGMARIRSSRQRRLAADCEATLYSYSDQCRELAKHFQQTPVSTPTLVKL